LPLPFVNVISEYRMFAKPILLNSLTSCDFVFSEQTQNLNETAKTLYIEAIFVFLVHKINIEKTPDKNNTIQTTLFSFSVRH